MYVINGTLVIGHDVEELNTSVTLQVGATGRQTCRSESTQRPCELPTQSCIIWQPLPGRPTP